MREYLILHRSVFPSYLTIESGRIWYIHTFTHVRTIFVQSTKTGDVGGKELMEQLHAAGLDKNVERFTYQGKPGHFSLTTKDEEKRAALEESWEEKLTEGTLSSVSYPRTIQWTGSRN